MDCCNKSCTSRAKSFCDRCTPNIYFCTHHAGEHTLSVGHFPKEATSEQLQLAFSKVLKDKKAIIISKIINTSSKIIKEIKLKTQRTINSLKEYDKNLEILTSYNEIVLNLRNIDKIQHMIKTIFENIRNVDHFKELARYQKIYTDSFLIQPIPIYQRTTKSCVQQIYKGNYLGQDVAVKRYLYSDAYFRISEKIIKEMRILKRLSDISNRQNCFIEYYGFSIVGDHLDILLKWYPHNLMDKINILSEGNQLLSRAAYMDIIGKILNSYALMASIGIIHNDIKPYNILVDDSWDIKFIDFGISLLKDEDYKEHENSNCKIGGSLGYLSPEKKKAHDYKITKIDFNPEKSDVYSLGIVFYELLTLQRAKNKSLQVILSDIKNLSQINNETKMLLKRMLDKNPSKRPSFKEALIYLPSSTTKTLD